MKFTGTVIHVKELVERENNGTVYRNREVIIHTVEETPSGRVITNNVKVDVRKEDLLKEVDGLNKGDEIVVMADLYGSKLYEITQGDNKGQLDISQSLVVAKLSVLKKANVEQHNEPTGTDDLPW